MAVAEKREDKSEKREAATGSSKVNTRWVSVVDTAKRVGHTLCDDDEKEEEE